MRLRLVVDEPRLIDACDRTADFARREVARAWVCVKPVTRKERAVATHSRVSQR